MDITKFDDDRNFDTEPKIRNASDYGGIELSGLLILAVCLVYACILAVFGFFIEICMLTLRRIFIGECFVGFQYIFDRKYLGFQYPVLDFCNVFVFL